MRELLSNNLLFVGQFYEDKSIAKMATDGPPDFCHENGVCFLRLLHIFMCYSH